MKKMIMLLALAGVINCWATPPTQEELNKPWTKEELAQGGRDVGTPEYKIAPGTKWELWEIKKIGGNTKKGEIKKKA